MKPDQEWEKKVRRILMDPDGRQALKKFGIDVEIVSPEEAKKEIPTVVILSPSYRAPEPQCTDSVNKLIRHTNQSGKARCYTSANYQGGVVHWVRNWLLSKHILTGNPWTHVLWIDDDMTVEPDALTRLLAHGKDIVGGLCTRRIDPPIPAIRHYDPATGSYDQIWEWPENQLFDTEGAIGTGFLLVSRHACEQVAQAYFDCLWERDFYQVSEAWIERERQRRLAFFDDTKNAFWFRFLLSKAAPIEMGEDTSFCHMAREYCGLGIYCDSAVQPGHLGKYDFGLKDFLPYRSEMIARAKATGTYHAKDPDKPDEMLPISILAPTRKRPQQVRNLLRSIQETATYRPEVVFYVDEDDKESIVLKDEFPAVKFVIGPRICLSQCWNKCAEVATGEIFMHAGDDFLFKTEKWDEMVMQAFRSYPDRLILVHGDDGHWGEKFGTHSFVHRRWVETVGYFLPPYFSSDYNDTWLNEVAERIGRRIYLPFVNEHLHPLFGKGEWDETHQDRLKRHQEDKVDELYQQLAPKRAEDAAKLMAAIQAFSQKGTHELRDGILVQ